MNPTSESIPLGLQVALSRGRIDPIYFAEELLGLRLHDGQKKYLRNASKKINLLVSANRWGKSVTMAILHIWHCFYKLGVLPGNTEAWSRAAYATANLGPHSDTTLPVFRTIIAILTSSFPIPQSDGSLVTNDCKIGWFLVKEGVRNSVPAYIPFINKAEILFRSTGEDQGTSIQGRNFGLITYDEGGRSKHLQHELTSNILPRLADLNGSLHIPSTPDMSSPSLVYHSELYDMGQRHEEGYYSQSGSITENFFLLRNNPTYVQDTMRQLKGDPLLDQVLHGKFVFSGAAIYPAEEVKAAIDDSLNEGIRGQAGHKYIIGIDTSIGEDERVYTVLDITSTPYRVVRQLACKGSAQSPQMHMYDLETLWDQYVDSSGQNIKVILETWNGESKIFYLNMPPHIQRKTKCFGSFQPIGVKELGKNNKLFRKAEIIVALRKLLASSDIKIPNEPTLIKQLTTYREEDSNLQTDRVIALCLASWYATEGKPKFETPVFVSTNW